MAPKKSNRWVKVPQPLKWKLDLDYLDDLSPKDKDWMLDFLDAHYNGDFRSELGKKIPLEERRKIYAEKAAAREDLMASGSAVSVPKSLQLDNQEAVDDSLTPEYLDDPEYKEALTEYRKLLAQTRSAREPKTDAHVLEMARLRLKKAKRN